MAAVEESGGLGEEIPADRVVEALAAYQRRTIGLYETHRAAPAACVMALVRLHLEWTEEDPERARMVARHRNAVMAGTGRDRLMKLNAAYFERTREWLDREVSGGTMPPISFNLLHALVFAPSQEIAKLWLGGRLRKSPTGYADRLGRAAWAGILAAATHLGEAEGTG